MTIRTALLFAAVLASPAAAFTTTRGHVVAPTSSFALKQSMKPVYVGDKQSSKDEYQPEKPSALVPVEQPNDINHVHLNEKKYHWTDKQPVFEVNWDGSVPKYVDMTPHNRQSVFFY